MIWELLNILIGYAFLQGAIGSYKRLKRGWLYKLLLGLCGFFAYILLVGTIFRVLLYLLGILDSEVGSILGGVLLFAFAIPYVFILRKYLKKVTSAPEDKSVKSS